MKVAIVGSRSLDFEIDDSFVPQSATMIISGGARGIDRRARNLASKRHIPIVEILPDYELYGKKAPIYRNDIIISKADMVVAIWDGISRGTRYVIDKCEETGKKVDVYIIKK